jgi:di/tripeptidase
MSGAIAGAAMSMGFVETGISVLEAGAAVSSAFSAIGGIGTIGAALGAVGAISSANASAQSANYQSAVAANNAKQAQENASRAAQAGEITASMQERKTAANVGSIRAAQAANGVDVNSGSALDVRSSAAELGQLDAINIRSNAAREAYGYQAQSASYTGESDMYKSEASNDKTSGLLNAGSTLLSGVGNAVNSFEKFKMNNSF